MIVFVFHSLANSKLLHSSATMSHLSKIDKVKLIEIPENTVTSTMQGMFTFMTNEWVWNQIPAENVSMKFYYIL